MVRAGKQQSCGFKSRLFTSKSRALSTNLQLSPGDLGGRAQGHAMSKPGLRPRAGTRLTLPVFLLATGKWNLHKSIHRDYLQCSESYFNGNIEVGVKTKYIIYLQRHSQGLTDAMGYLLL